jgi:hypothetical protein
MVTVEEPSSDAFELPEEDAGISPDVMEPARFAPPSGPIVRVVQTARPSTFGEALARTLALRLRG